MRSVHHQVAPSCKNGGSDSTGVRRLRLEQSGKRRRPRRQNWKRWPLRQLLMCSRTAQKVGQQAFATGTNSRRRQCTAIGRFVTTILSSSCRAPARSRVKPHSNERATRRRRSTPGASVVQMVPPRTATDSVLSSISTFSIPGYVIVQGQLMSFTYDERTHPRPDKGSSLEDQVGSGPRAARASSFLDGQTSESRSCVTGVHSPTALRLGRTSALSG